MLEKTSAFGSIPLWLAARKIEEVWSDESSESICGFGVYHKL